MLGLRRAQKVPQTRRISIEFFINRIMVVVGEVAEMLIDERKLVGVFDAHPGSLPYFCFDFDGATFSHVEDRVTFETLLASFGLDADPALVRLGAMINTLDVGGTPVPEASGFEAILAGASERLRDDDALLQEMSAVLDSLYLHFTRDGQTADKRATPTS